MSIVEQHLVEGQFAGQTPGRRIARILWPIALVSFLLTGIIALLFPIGGRSLLSWHFWLGFCLGGIAASLL